jgi:hypothetical protein
MGGGSRGAALLFVAVALLHPSSFFDAKNNMLHPSFWLDFIILRAVLSIQKIITL